MTNLTNETFPIPFGPGETIAATISLIFLCVFGLVANAITIITILQSKRMKSSFYLLIVSLCVSDFLSALISPIALNRLTWGYDVWNWGEFSCQIFWAVDIWTSYVTSFHITLFAFLRFFSVQWPFAFKRFTVAKGKICIFLIWTVTFGCGFFPTVLWYGGIKRNRQVPTLQYPSCSLKFYIIPTLRIYRQIAYPIFFYVPFLVITLFSIALPVKMNLHAKNTEMISGDGNGISEEERKNRRAVEKRKNMKRLLQLCLIVGSFLLGYIPRTVYHFYSAFRSTTPGLESYPWMFAFVEYLLLRISECLNPIFYNLSSKTIREETGETIRRAWSKAKTKTSQFTETITTLKG